MTKHTYNDAGEDARERELAAYRADAHIVSLYDPEEVTWHTVDGRRITTALVGGRVAAIDVWIRPGTCAHEHIAVERAQDRVAELLVECDAYATERDLDKALRRALGGHGFDGHALFSTRVVWRHYPKRVSSAAKRLRESEVL